MLRHAWMGLVLLAGQTAWAGVSEDLEKLLATGSCHGCDLSGVDLNGQTLNWTSLKNSKLVGANLSGAEIRVAQNIEGNDFSGANLKGTKVWTPQLNGNIFKGTDLSEASLNASSGHGLQWSFQRNQFIQATLTDAVISTDLCYLTTFKDSNLTRMKFTANWVARACNVSQSKAEGSEWNGWLYSLVFDATDLSGASMSLDGKSLVTFKNSILTGSTIQGGKTIIQGEAPQG